jgi:hypothetical protein
MDICKPAAREHCLGLTHVAHVALVVTLLFVRHANKSAET